MQPTKKSSKFQQKMKSSTNSIFPDNSRSTQFEYNSNMKRIFKTNESIDADIESVIVEAIV